MKKRYLFWTCCLAMLLLAGCDTDGGDSIDQSFTSYSIKVMSPAHFDDLKNVTATIDGENITGTTFKGRSKEQVH